MENFHILQSGIVSKIALKTGKCVGLRHRRQKKNGQLGLTPRLSKMRHALKKINCTIPPI